MTQQTLSPAEQYEEILKACRENEIAETAPEELFDVKVSSGMVFKCRKPNLETYVISGIMPFSFTERLTHAMERDGKMPTAATLEKELSASEALKTLIFARELVRDICVSPAIVEIPTNGNEIAPHKIDIKDFKDLTQWGMQNLGGAEAARLNNFRRQPVGNADARPRRKRNRRKR